MIYFLLPNVNTNIYKYIDCVFSEIPPEITISNSLSHYLFEIKNKIKQYENDWNDYKKYTNPYEFINTIIPGKNKCVSKYKPLSRSYFKMIEILQFLIYNLREPSYTQEDDYLDQEDGEILSQTLPINLQQSTPIRTFHLAEGPGGFIEATANMRNNSDDIYYGMTILDDAENNKIYSLPEVQEKGMNVPGWKKTEAFLRSHPNVILEHGADKTGNILSMENFLYCREKYGGSMDLITGDGGFDFSVDFNNQETNISALLFAQVCYAICLQKQGGYFILKIFDCFMDHTVDILYILSSLYEKVYISKPQTSRYANSEKYIICKNFLVANNDIVFPYFKNTLYKILNPTPNIASSIPCNNLYIRRFLNISIPIFYIYKIEEYNAIFGQQQIENIYQTIILIENTGNYRFLKSSSRNGFSRSFKKNCTIRNNTISKQSIEDSQTKISLDNSNIIDTSDSCKTNDDYSILNDKKSSTGELSKTSQKWARDYDDKKHEDNIECSISQSFCNSRSKNMLHPKMENIIRSNIQKCIQWCIKHNIAYYNYND